MEERETAPQSASAPLLDEEVAVDEFQATVEAQLARHSSSVRALELPESDQDITLQNVKRELSPGRDEESAERELLPGIETVIDLTGEDEAVQQEEHRGSSTDSAPPARNSIPAPADQLQVFQHNPSEVSLRPGMLVEINEIRQLYHAAFLMIQYIIDTPDGIVLRGLPLTRTRFLRGQLPRYRNEVCLVLQIDENDHRDDMLQAAVDVPVTDVIRERELHITNEDFPIHRFGGVFHSIEDIENKALLACRWKYRLLYKSTAARKARQLPCHYVLTHLRAEDILDAQLQVSDTTRLNRWRGNKVRGGSYNVNTRKDLEAIEDLESDGGTEVAWIKKDQGQRYTMGDMFSGAGGTSLGAQQAGLHIRVACDNAQHACATHRRNFPETDLREEDIWKFISEDLTWGGKGDYVDVLHLSPPCQFWSPAHTVSGQNDDANIAVLFSCHELIKKLKPRIFTLEQTFGILHPRFEHYFNALLHGFTQYSYSVRWRVIDLLEWGLPSRRNRLVMIGACPGEKLPTFPASTHARNPPPGSGLKPFTTVKDAMKLIPPNATMHEKKHVRFKDHWDPSIPLARCITTHGGFGNYHYSGRRDFTNRELATMNGFPAWYEFHPQNVKKQIGNAFPARVVRVLYSHLLKWLEDEDRVMPVEEQSRFEEESEYEVVETDVEDDLEYLGQAVKERKNSASRGTIVL
ncbi:hypothetical protein PFICI_08429 [Pestalotiopsis fici W106-1]|uniref:DNA (cytosine-5-)-methyltransferase n=1 Tax=Pestalotiopsis fici (strain W106-1 / CGMCC3.15140) TaxID=1229662 RepID=W3X4B1_PESFW|nr:uncharacterized protein PFICI_08429 [Pestalotiopsis fici W106-1]ETS80900.1 hypothetical protein PFICI_08429 [Pestalotiopsis fici W106-1]